MSSTLSTTGQQLPDRPNVSDVLAKASASASDGSTNESMSTSNQQADQATSRPGLVTQADYIAADIMNRDGIDNMIDDLEAECASDENATSAFVQMCQKTISIYRKALGHSSPVVSLNLQSLAQGMEQIVHFIDDSKTIPFSRDPDYKRIKDLDFDVEASKAAKLRLVKFMEDEAMILGNKDMENFLIWASGLVDWMNDSFEMTKEAILEQRSAPGGVEAYEKGQWREDEDEDEDED